MEKKLKKYTTIPENLYVTRSADVQLKRIIEDMQRPGYVLVARQMGKTNLLFHAKRTLENENRLFVYVDLSNLDTSERDCYRNIIDNITEPNDELFRLTKVGIEEIREKGLPPHNEYSRSLRSLLKSFTGEMVIVLDEIDALKSVEYSDNIFAQIRSNYFSRTNFPEFERLTYVLSGVIEPTELIKDRNKSPFNIGDKIYLDDFTEEEHNTFIAKSGLEISFEISNNIFAWAKGSPRLTFDICSEIENYILDDVAISVKTIDEIIKKKYLTTFDVAPIDHIREIVRSNKQIRQSVSLINKKQAYELTDEIKRKLYLYGIIDSKFDKETEIKNAIIKSSLSEEWIRATEKLSTSSYTYGLEQIDSGDYHEAVLNLLEFLDNSTGTRTQIDVCNYNIGFAYYKLRDYAKAIDYFSKEFLKDLYKHNSYSLLGICKIGIGNLEEGRKILEEVVETKANNFAYRNALLNLANNLPPEESERALVLLELLCESTDNSNDEATETELRQLKTLARYYQAELHSRRQEESEALDKVNDALNYSSPSDSLFLLFFKYYLESEKDKALKDQLVSRIVDNEVAFDRERSDIISFVENHLYLYLDFVFDLADISLFEKLLDYTVSRLLPSKDRWEIIYKVVLISSDNKLDLLRYLIKFHKEIKDILLLDIYSELAYQHRADTLDFFGAFAKYIALFTTSERVTGRDVYLIATAAKKNVDNRKFSDAIKLCDIVEPRLITIPEDSAKKIEPSIIYYWYSVAYFYKGDKSNAKRYAEIALKLLSNSVGRAASIIDEKGLSTISEQLQHIKTASTVILPIIRSRKYGRNEIVRVRYPDGKEVERKYKQIETDLLAERCKLI